MKKKKKEDILYKIIKQIEKKYNSGKYTKFNFNVRLELESVAQIDFDTTEYFIESEKE